MAPVIGCILGNAAGQIIVMLVSGDTLRQATNIRFAKDRWLAMTGYHS